MDGSNQMTISHGGVNGIPENVLRLKPVEIVEFQPTNAQIYERLIELQDQVTNLYKITLENQTNIETATKAIGLITEQVTPTLEMLTKGPIGQLLGIAPPPEPRTRRGRH
jgi:hypothetical protein